jgi:ribosomal protein S27AE
MPGVSQPPNSSDQIDPGSVDISRAFTEPEASDLGLVRVPREAGGTSRVPVPRALESIDDAHTCTWSGETHVRSIELLALSPVEYKVVENRLRRMADRQNLQLVKSRRRARGAPDHGRYMLVDALATVVPAGGDWSLDLGEIEQILLGTDPATRRLNARDCPKCAAPTYTLNGLVAGALIDDRECPDCGESFIAEPEPEH